MPSLNLGAFASHAHEFFNHGLAVLPTGGEDGKRPLIKGFGKSLLGPAEIDRFIEKFPDANLGFKPGHSQLVILDVDSRDATVQREAIRRFGDTLVKVVTGSGNLQAYYRACRPVASMDLRHIDGEGGPIEIKGDGTICIAPPSVNPKTGGEYAFIEGGLKDLRRLPEINLSSISMPDTIDGRKIDVGLRNNTLFRVCLREARHCDDLVELIDAAKTYAEDFFVVPMGEREIIKTATSAWRYESDDLNWVGKEAHVVMPKSFIKQMALDISNKHSGDAFMLLALLLGEHSARQARGEPFALVFQGMAKAESLPDWTAYQYATAARELLRAGYLECIRQGKGRGHPSLYCLTLKATKPVAGKGVREVERWVN
jgi:Bifunctional DNA primase/polymerase, N-terminal/Primase C terminal 1 (PriCT-1)